MIQLNEMLQIQLQLKVASDSLPDDLLCLFKGDENIYQILKTKWWKYLLMGLTDVQANYAVVKAYQYTTLTSIQVCRFIYCRTAFLNWSLKRLWTRSEWVAECKRKKMFFVFFVCVCKIMSKK